MDDIRTVVSNMEEEEKKLLDKRTKEEDDSVLAAKLTIIIGSLVAFVSLFALAFVLTRGITGPLQQAMEMAQQIAAGNLKQEKLRVASSDEMGQLGDRLQRHARRPAGA